MLSEDKVDICDIRVRLYISLFSSHEWGGERCCYLTFVAFAWKMLIKVAYQFERLGKAGFLSN